MFFCYWVSSILSDCKHCSKAFMAMRSDSKFFSAIGSAPFSVTAQACSNWQNCGCNRLRFKIEVVGYQYSSECCGIDSATYHLVSVYNFYDRSGNFDCTIAAFAFGCQVTTFGCMIGKDPCFYGRGSNTFCGQSGNKFLSMIGRGPIIAVRVPSFYGRLDFTGTGAGTQFLRSGGFYWDRCGYPS